MRAIGAKLPRHRVMLAVAVLAAAGCTSVRFCPITHQARLEARPDTCAVRVLFLPQAVEMPDDWCYEFAGFLMRSGDSPPPPPLTQDDLVMFGVPRDVSILGYLISSQGGPSGGGAGSAHYTVQAVKRKACHLGGDFVIYLEAIHYSVWGKAGPSMITDYIWLLLAKTSQ